MQLSIYAPVPNNGLSPPHLLIFGYFVGPLPPSTTSLSYVNPQLADISETVERDCSFWETVSSLV